MAISNLALRTSSNTGQPISPSSDGRTFRIFFSFKLTGNYATAGDTLDLTQLFSTSAAPPGFTAPAALPEKVQLRSVQTPGPTNLFVYSFAPGTTLANGKVQVFTGAAAQTALTELSAGAYPAGVTGDLIEGEAIFPRL